MSDGLLDPIEPAEDPSEATLAAVLSKLAEISSATSRGSFVFRGEPRNYPEISSSLYRQYRARLEPFGLDGFDIRHVQEEILADAMRYTGESSPEDVLSQLQHYGHPTNLIDFSTDYLIALFFACASEPDVDGRLILLDAYKNSLFRMRSPLNRIKAQKSIFINPPSGVVTPDYVIRIPHDLKPPILDHLRTNHEISARTIYDDIHGYIRNSNIHRSAYAEFHIGGLLLSRSSLEEALEHYDRSIELDPYQTASLVNRAVTLVRMGRYEEAIRDYSRVIALDPQDALTFKNRGQIHSDHGRRELAERDFSEAMRLDPSMEEPYILRAALSIDHGDHVSAIRDLDTVIAMNPRSSAAFRGKGLASAAAGDYKSALRDISVAIDLQPRDEISYMSRALIFFAAGQYLDAIADLDKYIELDGSELAEARFRRGIALVMLGRFDEARAELKAASSLDPFVVGRVVKSVSDVLDATDSHILDDEVPADILAMLEPRFPSP